MALALGACGGGPDDARPIEVVREVELLAGDRPRPATVAERFGLDGPTSPQATGGPRLDYRVPPGWKELPPTTLRAANFRVAGEELAECYLTLLPGEAGGLAANVNRWRQQMSLPPLSSGEVEVLPSARLMGREAALVDFTGTFSNGSGTPHDDWRLVGLLAFDPSGAVFLKMTGPRDLLERELGNFHALARTMGISRGGTGASQASEPADTPGDTPGDAGGVSEGGLAWTLPEGWRRGPDRTMRVASFLVGEADPVECYITVLGGDGGGALANVNRWRRQLGQEPVDIDGLDALERVPMLGDEGLLAEIEGQIGGEPAMMLGAICLLGDMSLFVKMTGPLATVAPERDAFASFAKSLRAER